jgi:hypothetical protein
MGRVLRNKGTHRRRVVSVGGEVELSRRYFWARGTGGVYPVDEAAGIDQANVSPGAREVLCRLGMVEDFENAAEDARRIGNLPVCRERLRQIVEAEAGAVTGARNSGKLAASWSSADARVGPGGPTRVYEGTDGVMAPTVTQEEKDKRRKAHAVRRQQRSATGVGNTRDLAPARPGSDERYKEMKIGVFYDQPKKHRHAFATEADSKAYGPLLKEYGGQIGFERADQQLSLVDGARWIQKQVCSVLLLLHMLLLDFYHMSQHVHAAAKCALGDTPAAKQWVEQRLEEMKELGVTPVLTAIDTLKKQVRSAVKRKALVDLRDYLTDRLDMLDYRTALANGWDIGSGPTEAMCKTLTLRLKRPGMKWDRDHAAGMMNLQAMYESGQAASYWSKRRAA